MTRFRYVVFDLDGTLIDSYQAITIALNRTGASLGAPPFNGEDVRGIVGEGIERLLQKAFNVEASAELIALFEREYDRVCCDESHLLEEVEETLSRLAQHGVGMGVCTNKPTSFSRQIVAHLELARYLPVVVGPDRAGARKPSGDHVLATMAEMGAVPAETLFVGDMPIDIAAARAAQLPVAAIATGSSSTEELQRHKPDFFLQRFSQLFGIVETGVLV